MPELYLPLKLYLQNKALMEYSPNGKTLYDLMLPADIRVDFVLSDKFLKQSYQPPSALPEETQEALLTANEKLRQHLSHAREALPFATYKDLRTELRDTVFVSAILSYWGQFRQAYQFDKDFTDLLLKTDNIKLPLDSLKHMPYPCYYLDLSKDDRFSPFVGIFVTISIDSDTGLPAIALLRVTPPNKDTNGEPVLYSVYFDSRELMKAGMLEKENGTYFLILNQSHQIAAPMRSFLSLDFQVKNEGYEENIHEFLLFIFQTLLYLSSQKPDLSLSTRPSHKEKPHAPKKPSEVKPDAAPQEVPALKVFQVGARYGSVIRKQKQTSPSGRTSTPSGTTRKRASHMRSAHWHHYWTGKGRTELVLRWIPPVFVNGNGQEQEFPATIHPVKK